MRLDTSGRVCHGTYKGVVAFWIASRTPDQMVTYSSPAFESPH